MMKLTRLLALSAFAAGQAFAHSHDNHSIQPDSVRLIEFAPGQTKWATGEEMNTLSEKAHKEGRCGGFMDITKYPFSDDGFSFASLIDFNIMTPTQMTAVQPLINKVSEADFLAIVTRLAAFNNRYYTSQTGVDASNWIASEYKRIAGSRTDIKVEQFNHDFDRTASQSSVIATIEGNGPKKNEIVVIGGHIDSINQGLWVNKKKARAPGADDNASGTATVMEAFRILVESGMKPNRTIQFMGYAGEEVGLLGSQDIAQKYKKEARSVASVMQLDMTMFPGNKPAIVFMEDYTDDGLTSFMGKLVDTYVKAPWSIDQCGYACSDHASWHKAGYPSVMPFETTMKGMNKAIHTASDTLDQLSVQHGLHYIKLALAYVVEVSESK